MEPETSEPISLEDFVDKTIASATEFRETFRLESDHWVHAHIPAHLELTEELVDKLAKEHHVQLHPPIMDIELEIPEPEPRWALYCDDDEVERFTWQRDAFTAGNYHIADYCPKGTRKWAKRLTIHWREDGLTIKTVSGDFVSRSYWRAEIEGVSLDHTVRNIEGES